MDYSRPASIWKQTGNICFWRFKASEHHKFTGWHFNADEAGCDSLLALLSAASKETELVQRTVMLASSRSDDQSRVVGLRGDLRVSCPEKLRVVYRPEEQRLCSLHDDTGFLTMTLGPECLREVSDAISKVKAGDGDFTIRCDSNLDKRGVLFFWWWLKD